MKKIIFSSLLLTAYTHTIKAQNQNISIIQDAKFEQLLSEKRKLNTSLSINDVYKIQIFNGGNEKAKSTLSEFKKDFKEIDATIVFNTPNYKVWVGSYKSRIEAEKRMLELKHRFKNMILIKPNK